MADMDTKTNDAEDVAVEMPESEATKQPLTNNKLKYLEWKNVNVIIEVGGGCRGDKERKQILHGVSGALSKGKLLAIMGGSGAGKSTLLNALCGRLLSASGKEVTGDIAYNGAARDLGRNDHIKYISAYVMQSDILPPTETVHDALLFSAKLRLPKEMSLTEKEGKVNQIIQKLKLNDCKDTLIGNDAIRGVSGGEKKRCSVGVELVTDPELIFLDEPTSGLDSFTAQKTLEILKSLTQEGKQVITTIHQPSSEIFEMIDELCLLAKGKVAYFGPREKVIEYFGQLGYVCPNYTNPADYVVNMIQQNAKFFTDKWEETHPWSIEHGFESLPKLKPKQRNKAPICTQIALLLKREFNVFRRDKRPTVIRFVQTFIFAWLVAILYWNLPKTQEGLRDRFGAVFFITINSSMTGLISTIIVFPEQRLIYEKERNAGMYGTTTYVLAKSVPNFFEQCIFSAIYILIVYWTVGLYSTFWEVYVIITLCILASGSIGMIVGCFANNTSEAMQIMPAAFIPLLLFTNFMVSLDQIPVWIRWLQWLDVFKYVVEGFSITEFQDETGFKTSSTGGFANGNDYLDYLGYDVDNLAFTWYMTAVLFVGFRVVTWLILVKRNGW